MTLREPQQGMTLILVIGVIATLLILSTALVGLIWNTRHSTSTTVTQVKAFNVAEAGLDAGQQALWLNWPSTPSPSPSPSVTPSAFQSNFLTYPAPVSGPFIDVKFYDDDNNLANPGIRQEYTYDQNGNGYMWIVSRAATGARAAKVMALVQKVQYKPTIKSGVAIVTTGPLDVSGTGNQPVIGLDPPATAASVYAGTYTPSGQPDLQSGIGDPIQGTTTAQITGTGGVFPDEVLMNLIAAANGAGKEYATATDVPTSAWSSDPRIVVIDSGGIDLKDVPNTDPASSPSTIWSENNPGILIVSYGDLTSTGQKKTLYGIVYVNNGLVLGGNAEFHGMVVALGSAVMHGTRAIDYNQSVMDSLNKPITLSVKQVPNTWRELTP